MNGRTNERMKVWDDAGTEGRAGSIWMVNSLRLMAAGVGHDPPEGPFWDMKVQIARSFAVSLPRNLPYFFLEMCQLCVPDG